MSDTSYWAKGIGRGGEVEEFDSFADAEEYYHEMGKILDSEDMDILLTEDSIVIAAWQYAGKAWQETDRYTDQHIDNL